MSRKRVVIDIRNPVMIIYLVSDDYLRQCFEKADSPSQDLIDYIDMAEYFCIVLAQSKDIFNGHEIEHPSTLRTDGKWMWSDDLTYYTLEHNFKWPEDFFNASENVNGQPISHPELLELDSKYRSTLALVLDNLKLDDKPLWPYREVELQ